MSTLDSKVALVTGGASGLGLAIARRLLADGATVVVSDIQPAPGPSDGGHGLDHVHHDVTDEAGWAVVMDGIADRHGGLDILVNNAGIIGPLDVFDPESTRFSDWKKIFSVNVDGVFLGCRAAIPAMRARGGGSIINMASMTANRATPHATAYGASKAAVRHLTKSVAQYCASTGLDVTCNSVHPGNVLTPLLKKAMEDRARVRGITPAEAEQELLSRIPRGRFVTEDDVSAMVAFLVSDQARAITGAELLVDHGSVNCDTFQPS